MIKLKSYQIDAVTRMKNGCILNGGVGSGKSITSLAYFYKEHGGDLNSEKYTKMLNPKDLYIITTPKKRDTLEWEGELLRFRMNPDNNLSMYKKQKVVVDSWNNIKKYVKITDSFFIFDEQRVVGYGAWSKSFIEISRNNKWILLTATPGDKWTDYISVFIANKFYKNKSDFYRQHIILSHFSTYPKIEKYINEGTLIKHRRELLVNMEYKTPAIQKHQHIITEYNKYDYDYVVKNRWNIFTNQPIMNASEYCAVLRRITNSDISKQEALLDVIALHPKVIIFYTYNYELDILKTLFHDKYPMAEWNGHKHEPLPKGNRWVYLVEYIAGSEGWNCITTDTIVFFGQNYSYRTMMQASGRIDRMNTPYKTLWYYHLHSNSSIDKSIYFAIQRKKKFNESVFAPKDYFNKTFDIIKKGPQ